MWEYQVHNLMTTDEEQITKFLNKRGNDGWELVGFCEIDRITTYILKRLKLMDNKVMGVDSKNT